MAKQLPNTAETANMGDPKKDESGTAGAAPPATDAKTEETAAPTPTGFHDPKDVKVGEKHWLFNAQQYSTKCPYSGVHFPAGNFAADQEVEINEWIKSQVDAGLLKAKKK